MDLTEKLNKKEARIGIIGLGYVGLPLAADFANAGFFVLGIDKDAQKIEMLEKGENYIDDVDDRKLKKVIENGKLVPTTEYDRVGELDALFICVPTPFNRNKEPDVSYIIDATNGIKPNLRKGQVIVLKSTTFPETTEKVVQPLLEETGLKAGKDFYLAFSPERIDPGRRDFNTENTPIVLGGVTPQCTEMARAVIGQVTKNIHVVSSPKAAEMTKLLENIFRSVNIALVNELATLCDRMGNIDMWEVIDAAATKPFGFMPFYPGPGIGGHCILVDPYYLSWKAREYDFHTNFIELAAETNESMPYYVYGLIVHALSEHGVPLTNAKVLLLGAAFKKNVNDIRNSPALKLFEILEKKGMNHVMYNDSYVPELTLNGKTHRSLTLTPDLLGLVDCVVIATDHTDYDYDFIVKHAKLVIDTRNATKHVKNGREKIVRLGSGRVLGDGR
ncbi:UDP-N-acetyl-D-glucosamine 6-dehydrogenase [bacterium BMS3Abin05]|nr:UDP-N-acetyl-D-glucosamine 6-dehydrogenase [bacterium BMS3Abin05]GBE28695.1 UDP-N-acetyl-D-glucosamine 6-dehydrogenase [bacterium BMS3Bbin03]HDL78099.1 nucleotide sugar dehydrogenase [Bacteroidota bacterium]HDZ11446.1 nucleotide sugar dehydrogenase [Bacteroidota bacterium]